MGLYYFLWVVCALAAARNEVSGSGQADSPVAEELAAAAAGRAALASARLAQQKAAEESYRQLSQKRERGKQRERSKQAQVARKK